MRTRRIRKSNNAKRSIEHIRRRLALLNESVRILEMRVIRDESVLADWNAGVDTKDIALKHGIGIDTVYLISHVNDGNVRHNYRDLHKSASVEDNASRRKEIARLFDSGMPMTQIAKQIGCTVQRVSQIIRRVKGLSTGDSGLSPHKFVSLNVPRTPRKARA